MAHIQHRRLGAVAVGLSSETLPEPSLDELLAAIMNDEEVADEERRSGAGEVQGVEPYFDRRPAAAVFAGVQPALDDTGALKAHLEEWGFVVLKGLCAAEYIGRCRGAFEPRLEAGLITQGVPGDPLAPGLSKTPWTLSI